MATTTKTAAGPVMAAIYTALNVAAITSALGCAVYDDVTQGAAFPYLRISTPSGIPWDTFGKAGKERVIEVHVFSQYRGRKEAQDILDQVIALLQYQALTISGHTTIVVNYEQDLDGEDEEIGGKKTVHKVGLFRVIVQEI